MTTDSAKWSFCRALVPDSDYDFLSITSKLAKDYIYISILPEGKRPLGRPRRRWEDNIKMDLREVGGGGGD